MRDVGEGAAMDEGRACPRASAPGWACSASLSSTLIAPVALRSAAVTGRLSRVCADDDAAEPRFEIGEVAREAEDRHHLGGDGDVEAVLAREAVARRRRASETIARSARSFMSITRRQVMRRVSMPSALPQ